MWCSFSPFSLTRYISGSKKVNKFSFLESVVAPSKHGGQMALHASIICLYLSQCCRCMALQHPFHERPVCLHILNHLMPGMWFLFPNQRRQFNIKEGVQQFLHSELCLRLKDKRALWDFVRWMHSNVFHPS